MMEFRDLVRRLRTAQEQFFRTGTEHHKNVSKGLERMVDAHRGNGDTFTQVVRLMRKAQREYWDLPYPERKTPPGIDLLRRAKRLENEVDRDLHGDVQGALL